MIWRPACVTFKVILPSRPCEHQQPAQCLLRRTVKRPRPSGPLLLHERSGLSGVNDPLVYTFSGATGPDSGTCGNWATDTYDSTYRVDPNANGSFTVVKIVTGTFTTTAGPSPAACANGSPGNGNTVNGGDTGTFFGTESWTVASSVVGKAADFLPTASCGSACSPNTTQSGGSSSEAQNAAFEVALFPSSNYASDISAGENYDFVYSSHGDAWTDSNTPQNNQGDITG